MTKGHVLYENDGSSFAAVHNLIFEGFEKAAPTWPDLVQQTINNEKQYIKEDHIQLNELPGSPLTTSALFKRDLFNKMQDTGTTFHKDLEAVELTIDPMIHQYKVKAADMVLACFEKYQLHAVTAGFISPLSQSSILPPSLLISTSDRSTISQLPKQDDHPLESSDINWKL